MAAAIEIVIGLLQCIERSFWKTFWPTQLHQQLPLQLQWAHSRASEESARKEFVPTQFHWQLPLKLQWAHPMALKEPVKKKFEPAQFHWHLTSCVEFFFFSTLKYNILFVLKHFTRLCTDHNTKCQYAC
jgi:hypothetical protein